jgi:Pectate lyase superfamily protein
MSIYQRLGLLFSITLAFACPQQAANYVLPPGGRTVSVKDFGARGDGMTDDTQAIQTAINSLGAGGIVHVPAGTYLLNSYKPSIHPWFFYNILVGSNILIQGDPGAKFLQGPRGRSPMVSGATAVRNSALVFGSPNYATVTFQNTGYNGGFYALQPVVANSPVVTFSKTSQVSRFAPGDYVAIYASTTGDVYPGETSQVLSVNTNTGTLTLTRPLARSAATPVIANVTRLATVNVGVRKLIVQATEPLVGIELFNFTAEDCQFISDTSVTAGNTHGLNMNTMRDFRLSRNRIASVGPTYAGLELPQRNSQDGFIDANTIQASSGGFGEYAAHWTLTGNHISLFPDPNSGAMLAIGGLDVTFSNNDVQGAGTVPLLAEFLGSDDYVAYVGRITISGNSFTCHVDNTVCIALKSPDPVFTDNLLNISGWAVGVIVEGVVRQSATIQRNSLNGAGIVLNTLGVDASVVANNTITGAGGPAGIYIANPAIPQTGGDLITRNIITGFTRTVDFDPAKHPGTIVSDSVAMSCTAR